MSVTRAHVKIKHVSKNMMSPQSSVGQTNCTQLRLCLKVCDWGMGDSVTSDEDTGRTGNPISGIMSNHIYNQSSGSVLSFTHKGQDEGVSNTCQTGAGGSFSAVISMSDGHCQLRTQWHLDERRQQNVLDTDSSILLPAQRFAQVGTMIRTSTALRLVWRPWHQDDVTNRLQAGLSWLVHSGMFTCHTQIELIADFTELLLLVWH